MKTVLLIVFKCSNCLNFLERFAKKIDNKFIFGHKIKPVVLNKDFRSWNYGAMVRGSCDVDVKAIISLEMASYQCDIGFAGVGRNCFKGDCSEKELTLLDRGRPADEQLFIDFSRWDLEKIRDGCFKNGISAKAGISYDAGSCFSNALIYGAVKSMGEVKRKIPFISLDVPYLLRHTEELGFEWKNKDLITSDQLVKIIEVVLDSYKSGR